MRLLHALAALLCAGLLASPSHADAMEDEQLWVNFTLAGSAKGRLLYFAEVQPRATDGVSRLGALLLRPAIGWRLSDRISLFQGYVHVVTPVAGGPDRTEYRPFQQLSWTLPRGTRAELQSRTRLEQRWASGGKDMGLRLREMIRGEVALGRSGAGVRALGYAELFVALKDTDWGNRAGFDQLRSFAGVEVPLGGRSTLEAGYLNQLLSPPGGVTRVNHVLALAVFLRP